MLRWWSLLLVLGVAAGCERPASRPLRCVPDVTMYLAFEPLVPGQSSGGSAVVADLVYDRVLASPDEPGRSAAVILGDAGGVLQLELREARFHDGSAVTAADVAASIAASPLGADLVVTPTAPQRLEVGGAGSSGPLRRLLAEVPVAPARFAGASPAWSPPPGSGPYRLVSLSPALAELAAWEHAAGGRPPLALVRLSAVAGQKVGWARAMRGETDLLIDLPQEMSGFLGQLPSWTVLPSRARKSYLVAISPRARARDLAQLLDAELRAGAPPSIAGLPTGAPPAFCGAPRRRTQAPATSGPAAPLELLYFDGDGASAEAALWLQRRLGALQLEALLVPLPVDALMQRYASGAFDLGIAYSEYAERGDLAQLVGFVEASGLAPASRRLNLAAAAFDERGTVEPIQAAWSAELPLVCWFSLENLIAVRAPYARFPVSRPLIRSLLTWRPQEGCQ